MTGFEPATFAMARRRSSQLSYIRMSEKILRIEYNIRKLHSKLLGVRMYTYVRHIVTIEERHYFRLCSKHCCSILCCATRISDGYFFYCKYNWCTLYVALLHKTTRIMNIDQMSINGLIAISLGIIAIMLMLIHDHLRNRDKTHNQGKR